LKLKEAELNAARDNSYSDDVYVRSLDEISLYRRRDRIVRPPISDDDDDLLTERPRRRQEHLLQRHLQRLGEVRRAAHEGQVAADIRRL